MHYRLKTMIKFFFVSFEDLCKDPKYVLNKIEGRLDIRPVSRDTQGFVPPSYNTGETDPNLMENCREIFNQLNAISI